MYNENIFMATKFSFLERLFLKEIFFQSNILIFLFKTNFLVKTKLYTCTSQDKSVCK